MKETTPRKPSEIIQYYMNKHIDTNYPTTFVPTLIGAVIRYLDERAELLSTNIGGDELELPWEMNEEKPKKINKRVKK